MAEMEKKDFNKQEELSNITLRTRRAPSLTVVLVVLLLFLIGFLVYKTLMSDDISISTIKRSKIEQALQPNIGFEDNSDIVLQPHILQTAMESFDYSTGVQPYLVILPDRQITDKVSLDNYAKEYYSAHLNDDTHFLTVFCKTDNSFITSYQVGQTALSVMDDEAIQIFSEFLNKYFNDYTINNEYIFSNTYRNTADRIMTLGKFSNTDRILFFACIIIVFFLIFDYIMKWRKKKNAV